MKHRIAVTFGLLAASLAPTLVQAQSMPTATRTLQLSVFGGVSPVYTGVGGGKNFSVTAGGALGLPPWHGVRPTIEVRGTYPADRGDIDAQKTILAGVDAEFLINHRFRPYADFLVGRGEINYKTSQGATGYEFNGYIYSLTTAYVMSPGAGFNYQFTDHLALKIDGQLQRWPSPAPTPSGVIYSKVATAGIVYYFTFDGRHNR